MPLSRFRPSHGPLCNDSGPWTYRPYTDPLSRPGDQALSAILAMQTGNYAPAWFAFIAMQTGNSSHRP